MQAEALMKVVDTLAKYVSSQEFAGIEQKGVTLSEVSHLASCCISTGTVVSFYYMYHSLHNNHCDQTHSCTEMIMSTWPVTCINLAVDSTQVGPIECLAVLGEAPVIDVGAARLIMRGDVKVATPVQSFCHPS